MPKILILFIHGFLGSESSFSSFPLDLMHILRTHHKLMELEARVVPRFDSKGNIDRVINSIHNWLILNATLPEYAGVILLCHSMGGLIAIDALRKMIDTAPAEELEVVDTLSVEEPDNLEWEPTKSKLEPKTQIGKLNIISILAFDSPYFGMNSAAFTTSAGVRATEVVDTYLPKDSKARQTIKSVGDTLHNGSSSIISGASAIPSLASTAYSSLPTASQVYSSIPSASQVYATIPTASQVYSNIPSGTNVMESGAYFASSILGSLSSLGSISSLYRASAAPSEPLAVSDPLANVSESVKTDKAGADNVTDKNETEEIQNIPIELLTVLTSEELQPEEPLIVANVSTNPIIYTSPKTQLTLGPTQELLPIPDQGYGPLVSVGMTAAVLATGTYYAGGLVALGTMTFARRLVVAYALTHAEEAGKLIRFLYPIWGETNVEARKRMQFVANLASQGDFVFKCFYVQVK